MGRLGELLCTARRGAVRTVWREQRLAQSPLIVRKYLMGTPDASPHLTARQLIASIDDATTTDAVKHRVAQVAAAVRNPLYAILPLRPTRQEQLIRKAVERAYWKCSVEADAAKGTPMIEGKDWESASAEFLGDMQQPAVPNTRQRSSR